MIEFRERREDLKITPRQLCQAVEEFSLQVAKERIFGIAGPNGAGKSTLIASCSVPAPDERIARHIRFARNALMSSATGIGYLSELVAINPKWRTDRALVRFATLAGIPSGGGGARQRGDRLAGPREHRTKKIKALSKEISRAGWHRHYCGRKDSVLDEPTHGHRSRMARNSVTS